MPIQVECTSCGKKYQADDKMAGRRIKCRDCGNIFALPGGDPEVPAGAPGLGGLEAPANGETFTGESVSSFAGEGIAAGEDGEELAPLGRRNVRFGFRYAAVIDRWVPIVLLLGGILWLILTSIKLDKTGVTWILVSRISMLLFCYFVVIFPLGLAGVQMAGRDIGFQLPSTRRWRAAAVFMPTFAFGAVLWLVSGGRILGLVLGLAIGFVITCGAMILLFRLQSRELPAAAGYSGGMVVFAVAISAGILLALNALFSSMLSGMHKADLIAASPFGAAFSWPKPETANNPPPRIVKPVPKPEVLVEPVNPEPITTVTTDPPPDPGRGNPNPPTPQPPLVVAVNVPPSPPEGTEPYVAPPAPVTASPYVESINMGQLEAAFDETIRPATPGNWAALLRKSGQRGRIDRVWAGNSPAPYAVAASIGLASLNPWRTAGSAPYVPETQALDKYALSPDGDLLAHVSTFPSLSVLVFSYKEKRIIQTLRLQDAFGQAEVIGFATNERLLVHRQKDRVDGIELWDAKLGSRIKLFDAPHTAAGGSSFAIAPDGSTLAIAAQDQVRGRDPVETIFLFDLPQAAMRKLPVADLNAVFVDAPTGLAFSPDGTKIAALFEQDQRGLLVAFRTKNVFRPIISQPLVPMPVQPSKAFTGSSLLWLGEDAILLYGDSIISSANGATLGSLGISDVVGQYFTAPDLCALTISSRTAACHVAMVKLKMDQLAKGR